MPDDSVTPVTLIVGAPRSGTFLLSALIDDHLPLAVPFETHFIPLFARSLRLCGDLRREGSRRRLLRCIWAFLEIWTSQAGRERKLQTLHPFTLLAIRHREAELVEGTDSYDGIVRGLFQAYAEAHGKSRWADKSVFYAPPSLERLQRVIPRMKVVHVIRDGRDVCLSWRRSWFGPSTVAETARLWRRHVGRNREWGRAHPGVYLEVRFEDLLGDPQRTMQQLAGFLDVPWRGGEVRLDSDLARALARGTTHQRLAEPIDPSNTRKWRRAMRARDAALFEAVAGETLRSCGYPAGGESPTRRPTPGMRLVIAWSHVVSLVTPALWPARFKNMLPAVLLVADRMGVPMSLPVRLLTRRLS